MRVWPGFFDVDDRVRQLSDLGDQLEARGGQDKRFRLSWPGGGRPLSNGHFVTGTEAFWG